MKNIFDNQESVFYFEKMNVVLKERSNYIDEKF